MVREKEKEASRTTPRFRACNVVWLVLFTEFRSTERTRCGEKNRVPLSQQGQGETIPRRTFVCKHSLLPPSPLPTSLSPVQLKVNLFTSLDLLLPKATQGRGGGEGRLHFISNCMGNLLQTKISIYSLK